MTATRPRLLIARKLPDPVEERARTTFDAVFNPEDHPYPIPVLFAGDPPFDALLISVTEKLDAEAIRRLPERIRIVATYSVGTDHIDLEAARARGLVVTNTPDVLTDATADIGALLTLAACRRAGEMERRLRRQDWGPWAPTGLLGANIGGKKVGILGLGRIGRGIAERLKPFGVELHYHNRRPAQGAEALGAVYHATPQDLFRHSQILIIAAASTGETRGSIDAAALAAMPRGSFLVNIARGDILDEDAVFAALSSGHLAGAGLDVYRNEPNIDPRWRQFENVVLLPHIGSATLETRIAMGMRALDNLEAYFKGEKPGDQV